MINSTPETTPFVSVIMPIYNAEKYLRYSLKCAVSQTLKNIEIICINDGSTDDSLQIINEYAANDTRIILINQANAGYGAAVNRGIKTATGEYIAIFEPDDWIEPEMYEVLFDTASKNNLDVVKADYYKYWSNAKDELEPISKDNVYNQVFTPSPQVYHSNIWGSIWSALYRRDMLVHNGIDLLETPGAAFQDTGFIFKTNVCAKRMMLIDKAFLHYRQDNAASSINNKDKIFYVCNEYDAIDAFLKEHRLLQWQSLADRKRCEVYLWNLERLSAPNRRIFLERTKPFLLKALSAAEHGEMSLSRKKMQKLLLLQKSENKLLYYYKIKDFLHKLRSLI